jgi:pimeloyl-ACP methyl ester carboxylesterase
MKINYKEYIEKNKRHIKISLWLTSIISILIIVFLVLLNLNFMIGEQLRITLTPEYQEINSSTLTNVSFDVEIQLYNKFVCNAICDFTVADLSHDKLVYNGSFNSKVYKNKHQSFDIFLTDYGYGTNVYLYTIECVNKKTTLCPTTADPIIRKSLLTVNYLPSASQLSALDYSLKNYKLISDNIVNSSVILREIEDIYYNVNISFDQNSYFAIKSDLNKLNDDVLEMFDIWRTNDYSLLKEFIIDNNLTSRSNLILINSLNHLNYVNKTITQHNVLLNKVILIHSALENYESISLNVIASNDAPLLYPNFNYTSPISSVSSFTPSIKKGMLDAIADENYIIFNLNLNNYDYISNYNNVVTLSNSINNLNPKIINATILRLAEESSAIYLYSNIFCNINNINNYTNNNITNNILNTQKKNNISETLINSICDNYYASSSGSMINAISNISLASLNIKNTCARSKILVADSQNWNSYNSNLLPIINSNDSNDNYSNSSALIDLDSVNDSLETLLLEYKLLIDYESVNIKNVNYPKDIMNLYKNYISGSLIELYNISNPDELIRNHIFNSSLLIFNKNNIILSDLKFIASSCTESKYDEDWNYSGYGDDYINDTNLSEFNLIDINVDYYIMPDINLSNTSDIFIFSAPEIVRQCCMYNKCQSCEKKSKRNPLVLLHGHSFNQNSYAYQSIEIFNDFEKRFTKDKLYYSSGVPIPNKDITYGILGNYYVPILSKPTYYIATYNDILGLTSADSKTENIDTYALRLGESIDYIIQTTGTEKVDFVTHSMGGLVLRRYMQIFGSQKVGKVILVAAPNKGISDNKYALCKLFGATGECDNMRSSGIFIKKLNDFSNQPNIEEIYLVVGIGCDTGDGTGDGIVLINNSLLSTVPERNILYVNGTCSGTAFLHNDLLNTNKYPMVYDFVKSKLKN